MSDDRTNDHGSWAYSNEGKTVLSSARRLGKEHKELSTNWADHWPRNHIEQIQAFHREGQIIPEENWNLSVVPA